MTVVHITTVSMSLPFLAGHMTYLRSRGVRVGAIATPDDFMAAFAAEQGVECSGIAMRRAVSPLADVLALVRLWRWLRARRPDVVHAHTPKAGLLGTIAARLAGVPAVVYTIHGLPCATAPGAIGFLMKAAEWVTCRAATKVLSVSCSVRAEASDLGVVPAGAVDVLCEGSIGGIDAAGRFDPSKWTADGRRWRLAHGIPAGACVIGFVGRLTEAKGVRELVEAWKRVRSAHLDAHLVVVGPVDGDSGLPGELLGCLNTDPRAHVLGLDWNTLPIFAAMDLIVLPSHREGFPVVILEAAAMAVPAVVTDVTGCVDAVVDGVTGTIVGRGNIDALTAAIAEYVADPATRRCHGTAARQRVMEKFRPEPLWAATLRTYEHLLERTGRRRFHEAA